MRLGPLALVAVALLAGCGGLVGTSTETTVTPAPVPEPPATESTGSAIAPGVGVRGSSTPTGWPEPTERRVRNRSYV